MPQKNQYPKYSFVIYFIGIVLMVNAVSYFLYHRVIDASPFSVIPPHYWIGIALCILSYFTMFSDEGFIKRNEAAILISLFIFALIPRILPALKYELFSQSTDPFKHDFTVKQILKEGDLVTPIHVYRYGGIATYPVTIFLHQITTLPLFSIEKYAPIINSLSIVAFYILSKYVLKNERMAFISTFLWAMMDFSIMLGGVPAGSSNLTLVLIPLAMLLILKSLGRMNILKILFLTFIIVSSLSIMYLPDGLFILIIFSATSLFYLVRVVKESEERIYYKKQLLFFIGVISAILTLGSIYMMKRSFLLAFIETLQYTLHLAGPPTKTWQYKFPQYAVEEILFFIPKHMGYFVMAFLSIIGFVIVLRKIRRNNHDEEGKSYTLLLYLYMAAIIFIFAFFQLFSVVFFQRFLYGLTWSHSFIYASYFLPILTAFVLGSELGGKLLSIFHVRSSKRFMSGFLLAVMLLVSIQGHLSAYSSPDLGDFWLIYPKSDLLTVDWLGAYGDEDTPVLMDNRQWRLAEISEPFYIKWYTGRYRQAMLFYQNLTIHSEPYIETQKMLGIKTYPPPEGIENIYLVLSWYFTLFGAKIKVSDVIPPSLIHGLQDDAQVNLLYSNGEALVFEVFPKE